MTDLDWRLLSCESFLPYPLVGLVTTDPGGGSTLGTDAAGLVWIAWCGRKSIDRTSFTTPSAPHGFC